MGEKKLHFIGSRCGRFREFFMMWQVAWLGQAFEDDSLDNELETFLDVNALDWKKVHDQEACQRLTDSQGREIYNDQWVVLDIDGDQRSYQLCYRNDCRNWFFGKATDPWSVTAFKTLSSMAFNAHFDANPFWQEVQVSLSTLSGRQVVTGLFQANENMYTAKWRLLYQIQDKLQLTAPEIAEVKIFVQGTTETWPLTGTLSATLTRLGLWEMQSQEFWAVRRSTLVGGFARRSLVMKVKKKHK